MLLYVGFRPILKTIGLEWKKLSGCYITQY